MTREEQINQRAEAYEWTGDQFDIKQAFIEGAEWARKWLINKACEWLQSDLEGTLGYYATVDFINDFRKAMEE